MPHTWSGAFFANCDVANADDCDAPTRTATAILTEIRPRNQSSLNRNHQRLKIRARFCPVKAGKRDPVVALQDASSASDLWQAAVDEWGRSIESVAVGSPRLAEGGGLETSYGEPASASATEPGLLHEFGRGRLVPVSST